MDEPTSGLDPTVVELEEILKELREQGKTVIISSHILSELSEIYDIGIIEQGRVVLEGGVEDILSRINTSNPLIISIQSGRETALNLLKSHPYVETIAMQEDDVIVGFTGDRQDEALLLQQLVDAEVLVYGFIERGNLESVFMQITSHEEEKAVLIHENESCL